MNKQDMLKVQNCILKVDIRCVCNGCEQKVKKLLQKIDGVYSVSVDAEHGKVIVTGNNVDPAKLIKKLKRSGKHAELWGGGGQKSMSTMMLDQNFPTKQRKNLQVENNSKGGKDNKSQKGERNQNTVGGGQLAQFQTKGATNQKFDASDGGFDEFEDDDEFHDDYYDNDDEEFDHDMHNNKMMPVMGNGGAMNKKISKGNGGGNANINAKKGDDLPKQMKGKGGKSEVKNGNEGKQKAGGDRKESKSGGGGLIGRFLGFGEKSKKGGRGGAHTDKNMKKGVGVGGGNTKRKEGKKGGGEKWEGEGHDDKNSRVDDDGFGDLDIPAQGKGGKGKSKKGKGGDGQMGPMGPMSEGGPMGLMGQMRNIPMGDFQGMQMQGPQYNPQQQYMAMMMNQQQQAAMYGRPHPSMGYMPPPPMPSHPMADPMTHVFSDENTESCTIM